MEKSCAAFTDSIETTRRRNDEIDIELSHLAEAVATQGASPPLLKAIAVRATERKAIEENAVELRARIRPNCTFGAAGIRDEPAGGHSSHHGEELER